MAATPSSLRSNGPAPGSGTIVTHGPELATENGVILSAERMPCNEAEPDLPTTWLLGDSARAAFATLRLALQEGHVFAALTGPARSGKSIVLEAVLAALGAPAMRAATSA